MKSTRTIATIGAAVVALAMVAPVAAQSPAASMAPEASMAACDPGAAAGAKIIVNMKGPGGGNPFWAAVQKGAEEAGVACGRDVSVGPPTLRWTT